MLKAYHKLKRVAAAYRKKMAQAMLLLWYTNGAIVASFFSQYSFAFVCTTFDF